MYDYDHIHVTPSMLTSYVPNISPKITYRAATYQGWRSSGTILIGGTSDSACMPYTGDVPGLFTDPTTPSNCATPRRMYNVGTDATLRGWNNMWYRYDPADTLITPLETAFGQRQWDLFPGNKKRSEHRTVLQDPDSNAYWEAHCKNKTSHKESLKCMGEVEFYECVRDNKVSYAGPEWLSQNLAKDETPDYWLSSCYKAKHGPTVSGPTNQFGVNPLSDQAQVQTATEGSLSAGAIVGIVIAAIVVLLAIVIVIIVLVKKLAANQETL